MKISLRYANFGIRFASSSHFGALRAYSKELKCLDDAVNLFRRMVRTKPIPSPVQFSILFKTMINMKHYSSVVPLFREMLRLGIPISGFVLNNVINSYCLMHPNVRTYNTMITGFCLEGLLGEAKDMLRDSGYLPDAITYNVIVQGFLRCRKISEMATFMKEMAPKGFSFDATTTELLINVIRENPSVLDMIPELHSINKN